MKEGTIENKVGELINLNKKYEKQLYNLLTSIPTFLVLTILFLSVSFFGGRKELSMPAYLEKIKTWNQLDLSKRLSEIRLGARIMPGQSNLHHMDWVSITTETEEADPATAQNYFYNKSLHIINDTRDFFPVLNLQPEYVPFGDSKNYCFNIAWNSVDRWRVTNSYQEVRGLPQCKDVNNPKVTWSSQAPRNGIDLNVWRQKTEEIQCSSSITCNLACPGVYKPSPIDGNTGKCYTYEILKAVCLEIGLNINPESLEEYWEYRGGCFENDSPALYERAVPGRTYELDYIPIEVRADDDPFTIASKGGNLNPESAGLDLSFFGWLSELTFSFAIIGIVIFGLSIALSK